MLCSFQRSTADSKESATDSAVVGAGKRNDTSFFPSFLAGTYQLLLTPDEKSRDASKVGFVF